MFGTRYNLAILFINYGFDSNGENIITVFGMDEPWLVGWPLDIEDWQEIKYTLPRRTQRGTWPMFWQRSAIMEGLKPWAFQDKENQK